MKEEKEQSEARLKVLLTNLGFGESPRWHANRLWFANWGTQQIVAVGVDGKHEVIIEVPTTLPYCFDWLPDGRLLIVLGPENLVLCMQPDRSLVTHADLKSISAAGWNEIVVDGRGDACVYAKVAKCARWSMLIAVVSHACLAEPTGSLSSSSPPHGSVSRE